MVMDFLRSCYTSQLQYRAGDTGSVITGAWYFAAKTAEFFPGIHAFGSPTWDTVHPTPTDYGWIASAPRGYYSGRSLNTSSGRRFAGPQEWFRDGAPLGAPALPRSANGTPLECLKLPLGLRISAAGRAISGGRGNLILTGRASDYPPPPVCGLCSDATPAVVRVSGSGFTYGPFNALLDLLPTSPCFYELAVSGGLVTAYRHHVDGWILEFFEGGGGYAHYSNLFDSTCIGPFSLMQNLSDIGGDNPLTLTGIS